MPLLHMDTDYVRGVGIQLQQTSNSLQQQLQQLNGSVQTLSSAWQGPSANIFASEIQPLLQQLNQLTESGIILDQRLQREVDEWERMADGADGSILAGILLGGFLFGGAAFLMPEETLAPIEKGEIVTGYSERWDLEQYYQAQKGNTCGFQTTQNILHAFGQDPSLEEIKASVGYPSDKEGTQFGDYEPMFEHFGVDVTAHSNFDSEQDAVNSLLQDLEAGRAVVGRIDVDPLDSYWGEQAGGHALWITGVRTNEEGEITHFICNDSGQSSDRYENDSWNGVSMKSGKDGVPDGQGIEYPAQEFLDAWEMREFSYIVTDDPMRQVVDSDIPGVPSAHDHVA
ncbi:MAG: hypothetical protein DWQ04_15570 [Chloroflexi bacterium]|nr:MAG: hypothetical protein DWQ04_15570 [Chloroflexota bacterium]